MMLRNIFILICFGVFTTATQAQFESQVPRPIAYDPAKIVDSTYGIAIYKKLVFYLGGDSVRNDKRGYAVNGWQQDYYKSGKLLHKGFYIDGYLKTYKNYYESGTVERSYEHKNGNDKLGVLKTFYPNGSLKSEINYANRIPQTSKMFYSDGKIKSDIIYVNKNPVKWKDYFNNGNLQMELEYNNEFKYMIKNYNYYSDGKIRSGIDLIDATAKKYKRTDYYPSGKIKEEGELFYDDTVNDYVKDGNWIQYDEAGNKIMEKKFNKGKI